MTTRGFCGPLASEFAAFAATLEASASASKTTLTQLRALDRFTQQRGLPSGTIDETLARAWLAGCESRGPNTRRARYYLLRRFCRHLSKRRPDTFVPGESLRPRGRPPKRPHIYSREEIRRLLDGAHTLRDWTSGHPCPIRSKTMHTIILLLVTSGLRISEALHLSLQDVDLAAGVLSIHQSKFRKSRLVPVSAGTLEELRRYHDLRLTVAPADPGEAFFVSGRGTAYSPSTVQAMFRDLTIQSGLRGPRGRGPRLHDLRATFAVTQFAAVVPRRRGRHGPPAIAEHLPRPRQRDRHTGLPDDHRGPAPGGEHPLPRLHPGSSAGSRRPAMSSQSLLPTMLRGFFEDYLAAQRPGAPRERSRFSLAC